MKRSGTRSIAAGWPSQDKSNVHIKRSPGGSCLGPRSGFWVFIFLNGKAVWCGSTERKKPLELPAPCRRTCAQDLSTSEALCEQKKLGLETSQCSGQARLFCTGNDPENPENLEDLTGGEGAFAAALYGPANGSW